MKYRMLKVGEKIREGDEFRWTDSKWVETIWIGERMLKSRVGNYRRPITSKAKVVK